MNPNRLSPYVGLAFTSQNRDVTQALYVREWSSLGTVIIIIWDMLLLFNDEYVHIWRAPSFTLKWIYLFARYFPLLFQSISYYLLTHALPRPPISESICLAWTLAHIVSTRIMMAVIEGVLMLRVYALYSKSTTVGWFLVALFLMQRVIAIGVAVGVPKTVQFDEICRAKGKHTDTIVLGGGVLFTQAVIWTMTVAKRKVGMESRSNSRVVSLLLRDGAWAFIGIVALYSVLMPYTYLVELSYHVVFSWPISLLSIATCRIIINMQGLKSDEIVHPGVPSDPEDIVLPEFLGDS